MKAGVAQGCCTDVWRRCTPKKGRAENQASSLGEEDWEVEKGPRCLGGHVRVGSVAYMLLPQPDSCASPSSHSCIFRAGLQEIQMTTACVKETKWYRM